jgi:putative tributyrin esterase
MAWIHMHYHSEALRMPAAMEVLLPKVGSGPYATLYLLHEQGGDHTSWFRRTSLEQYVEGLPLAVVMPAGHLGWYTDMVFGRDYFQLITEELPRYCERTFPISSRREDRFIAGVGMGGYGAVKAALRASGQFAKAASFSGDLNVIRVYDQLDPVRAKDVFGSREGLSRNGHDLFAAAGELAQSSAPRPELYIRYGTDESIREESIRFHQHAEALGFPIQLEAVVGAGGWKDWDRALEQYIFTLPHRVSSAKGSEV